MPAFDLLVVGSGGGPSEVNSSGYLLKAHNSSWTDGIIGIEAGSGFGALSLILRDNPQLLSAPGEPNISAAKIYSNVRTYLITHAHLDHVLSLVLMAGSGSGPRKSIRGTRECLEDLQTIFAPSRVWPNLASWDPNDSDHLYLYDPLPDDSTQYSPLLGSISTKMMPLSHGHNYTSSAYFLRYEPSSSPAARTGDKADGDPGRGSREFLFFGDVMPDTLSERPLTGAVWRAAAPKIPHELDTIFIECSWPNERPDACLYGHLTPRHLVQELESLAAAVIEHRARRRPNAVDGDVHIATEPSKLSLADSIPALASKRRASVAAASESKRYKHTQNLDDLRGALTGLRVYIIHCKEDMEGRYDRPMHEIITEQVTQLVTEKDLGVEILAAVQGTIIQI